MEDSSEVNNDKTSNKDMDTEDNCDIMTNFNMTVNRGIATAEAYHTIGSSTSSVFGDVHADCGNSDGRFGQH